MKKHTLTIKQYEIQHAETKDNKACDKWLKQNGIKPALFTEISVEFLQAQRLATTILKEHGRYLAQNQAATLNNFLLAMSRKDKRKKLKPEHAYKVMNIGKEVNRKLFKAYKAIK